MIALEAFAWQTVTNKGPRRKTADSVHQAPDLISSSISRPQAVSSTSVEQSFVPVSLKSSQENEAGSPSQQEATLSSEPMPIQSPRHQALTARIPLVRPVPPGAAARECQRLQNDKAAQASLRGSLAASSDQAAVLIDDMVVINHVDKGRKQTSVPSECLDSWHQVRWLSSMLPNLA